MYGYFYQFYYYHCQFEHHFEWIISLVHHVTGHISTFKQFPLQVDLQRKPKGQIERQWVKCQCNRCLATNAWPILTLHIALHCRVDHSLWARFRLHSERIPTPSWTHETTIKFKNKTDEHWTELGRSVIKIGCWGWGNTPKPDEGVLQVTTLFQTTQSWPLIVHEVCHAIFQDFWPPVTNCHKYWIP